MEITYNLYRVSTKKQVDKNGDDIPMQKTACREFAEKMGWTVGKEYEEKGVSGFKVSAQDRDAIQELKEAALRQEFNILLVFMFDRIGRIDDETPFVVEWFVKHGIRVWSVKEGEQRFENHTDKLTNYIRFWQASGESEKTSMRIKTRMRQLTLDGQYTGGTLPYGYKLVKTGRVNKKGHEIHDLAIDPDEAELVREIYRMTLCDGYGSYRLASYLNEHGYKTHSGSKFQCNTVIRILKNRMYCGYLTAGDVTSDQLQHLKIIEEEDYNRVQNILTQRDVRNREKSQIAMTTKGLGMLSGNVYCAHCGGRLTTNYHCDKQMSAMQGFHWANYQLGKMHLYGQEVEKNKTAGFMSQSIADLNSKQLMLDQLQAKGYLANEVYQSQSREIRRQIGELKEKRQETYESNIQKMLIDVKHLKEILDEIEEPLEEFDQRLFEEIITDMTINKHDELTITVLGGLKFTELI